MCLPPWLVPTKSAAFSPLNDVWREGGLRACNIATLLLRQWIHGAVSSPESQFIRYKTRCSDCRACKSRNYWRGLAFSAASRLLFFVRFSLDKFYMILRACSGRMREDGNDGNKKKKKWEADTHTRTAVEAGHCQLDWHHFRCLSFHVNNCSKRHGAQTIQSFATTRTARTTIWALAFGSRAGFLTFPQFIFPFFLGSLKRIKMTAQSNCPETCKSSIHFLEYIDPNSLKVQSSAHRLWRIFLGNLLLLVLLSLDLHKDKRGRQR